MVRILFLLLLILTSFSVRAQQAIGIPKAGEGISTFLQRNNRPGRAYYKEFLELNKKRLRGKEELRLGVKYVLPPLKDGKENSSEQDNRKKYPDGNPVRRESFCGHTFKKNSRRRSRCRF